MITQKISLEKYIVICILFVVVLIGTIVYFEAQSHVLRFFEWIESFGVWAPLLFILIEIVLMLLILPGVGLIFTLGAGFMFGILKGSLYVIIGMTLGAMFAFLIARYLFSEKVSRLILTHSKLQLLNDEFAGKGWKMVLLISTVPFFPFKFSCYFFGLTQVSLRDFCLGVFFGIMPITITIVYLGSLAADLTTLSARSISRSHVEWAIYGVGFIIVLGTTVYIARLARKALDKYNSENIDERMS